MTVQAPPVFAETAKDGAIRIQVWVQPGARQDATAGVVDGRLKVKLRAPAVENKANTALVAFLAGLLGLPKSALELSNGQTGRKKTLRVRPGEKPDWTGLL
uniref:UPF0235 protein ENR59_00650 n=1 Tax=Fundidesulfovibrio putealis TaxID=270496 RepID=A0A7C3W7X9_9BACT